MHCVILQRPTWSQQRLVKCAVFGWLRGRQTQVESPAEVYDTVSEDGLPFPITILDNTHLRGDLLKQQVQKMLQKSTSLRGTHKPQTSDTLVNAAHGPHHTWRRSGVKSI